jgi:hypothetical protein
LIGEQSGELARFGVCQSQRAIYRDEAAVFIPVPEVAVAGDDPSAALQFEEEDAGLGDDEGVDFVYRAVVADEFETCVDENRVTIREGLTEEIEGLALVRVTRFGELFPATGR